MATTLAQGVEIVNESLRTLGYEYQIDTTNDTTMTAGLEAIGAYPPSQRNAIMEQMNLIVHQRNYGVMFDASKNKFRAFLIDLTEEGFGVEDIFHEIIDGIEPLWDSKDNENAVLTDLVSYDENKIHKLFHTEKAERQFKATIDKRNYRKVFTARGVVNYIDTKLANLSWSAEVYLQNVAVNLIKQMIENGDIVFNTGNDVNTKQGVANVVEKIKSVMGGFLTVSNEYNVGAYDKVTSTYKPVYNITNSADDIFIITTPEYMERLKVQGYANAFNLSQFELDGRIIYAPAGTDFGEKNGEKVQFVVIDRRTLLIGIKHWNGTSFFVPNVERVNHWLNTEFLKGYNTFFNAVAFTGKALGSFFGGEGASVIFYNNVNPLTYKVSYKIDDDEVYTTIVAGNTESIDGAHSIAIRVEAHDGASLIEAPTLIVNGVDFKMTGYEVQGSVYKYCLNEFALSGLVTIKIA